MIVFCCSSSSSSFNPRSREGNDGRVRCDTAVRQVSIHVPARGTTQIRNICRRKHAVSIHVPTRGTTFRPVVPLVQFISFNPRSHEGNDKSRRQQYYERTEFQSTFPRGERHTTSRSSRIVMPFQSTFPRGERQQLPIIFIYSPCSFLCNYTNRFLSIQVLPPITTLFFYLP